MAVLMIRSTVKPESADDVEQGLQKMFAAIEEAQPAGLRYASYRLADGVTYVAQLEIADGVDNPLPGIAEFREFQAGLKEWLAGPPEVEQFEVVGSYSS